MILSAEKIIIVQRLAKEKADFINNVVSTVPAYESNTNRTQNNSKTFQHLGCLFKQKAQLRSCKLVFWDVSV